MTEDTFWDIIERTHADTHEAQIAALTAVLQSQTIDDILSFQTTYLSLIDRADRWDLWGAAYLIIGGCSDDGFDDFRNWLISRGRAVFEAALADPENLADIDLSGELQFEDLRYVAYDVYKAKAGREMDGPVREGKTVGVPFEEDALAALYPRLAQVLPRKKAPEPDEPQRSPSEIDQCVNGVLADLAGKRLTSIVPVLAPGPIRKVAGISLYFALGRPRLEAPDWTIECRDAENLSTQDLAGTANGKAPDDRWISNEKERILLATQALFEGMRHTRIEVASTKRLDNGDLQLTLSNAPFCRSVVLHSLAATNDTSRAILVKQDDDHYYLTGNGISM